MRTILLGQIDNITAWEETVPSFFVEVYGEKVALCGGIGMYDVFCSEYGGRRQVPADGQ